MKNIVIVGISQTGVFELSSLVQENVAAPKGYKLLGGFFNVFGDRYKKDASDKHSKMTISSYEDGAYVSSFTLNDSGAIQEFRDYGVSPDNKRTPKQELADRIALLKKSKGNYVLSLTTWELSQIKKEAPALESAVLSLLSDSDTIAVDVDSPSEAIASYVLAHESGVWVRGNEEAITSARRVSAKRALISQFNDELETLKSLLRGAPSLRTVTSTEVEKGSAALKKLFGVRADRAPLFSRPKYKNGSLSYIVNSSEVKTFAKSLEA